MHQAALEVNPVWIPYLGPQRSINIAFLENECQSNKKLRLLVIIGSIPPVSVCRVLAR